MTSFRIPHRVIVTPPKKPIPHTTMPWTLDKPPANISSTKMILLTINGIQVEGFWRGCHGEYFVGWAPLNSPASKEQ